MRFRLKFMRLKNLTAEEEKNSFSFYRLVYILLFAVLIAYLMYIPPEEVLSSFDMESGKPVQEDIFIQKNIRLEDKDRTERKRADLIQDLIPVYTHSASTGMTQKSINDLFTLLRSEKKNILKSKKKGFQVQQSINEKFGLKLSIPKISKILNSDFFKKIDLTELIDLFGIMEKRGILYSKSGLRKNREGRVKIINRHGKTGIRDVDSFYDLKEVKNRLNRFFDEQKLSSDISKEISEIILELAEINIRYSDVETEKEKNRIINQITPEYVIFKKGDLFIGQNEIFGPKQANLLSQIQKFRQLDRKKVSDFYIMLLVLIVLFVLIGRFYRSFEKHLLNSNKLFIVTLSTLTLSAMVSRLSIFLIPVILNSISPNLQFDANSIFYAIPFGFSTLIVAFTFNLHSSVVFSFLNTIISGMICGWSFQIALYVLIGNLLVSFGIEHYQRLKRSPVLKAGLLWLLPSNLVLITLFSFNNPEINLSILTINVILGFFSAIMSPILANFIIPLWESLFNLITELKLIELNNLNLPIFREMMEKAPGTYHHSQMVASLAETAANDLELPQMILTSMALYHDIGKIDNPSSFTENHSVLPNPHLKITPKESAKMIKNHINDGMERAKKLKLPDEVSDAITQHHGTKLIKYFYDKAKEDDSVEVDKVQVKDYRYIGTKPQNIENGIIMLADQVEAASKSLSAPTEKEIKNVIRKIINTNIEENQFDECEGLTLKALNIIANSFYKKLSSIYHMRISYPGFDFKEKT